jgi:prolyl oligopeptidase PreP (S9A serine peptidase family)
VTRPGEDQIDVSDGMSIESKQWDVLIDPETIKSGSNQIIPDQGHKITRSDGTVLLVESAGADRNCWRWSDAFKTWRRVHTTIMREK